MMNRQGKKKIDRHRVSILPFFFLPTPTPIVLLPRPSPPVGLDPMSSQLKDEVRRRRHGGHGREL